MAIPITCPGCQAGFEVPENLAGKTIRCTSCKTQLTVPAAEAKKPFGWAGAAAQPAATAAPAKPAPAKAAVAVDEDDRKTSPSKPASKNGPTIKGAIKPGSKRRDDDDDDDDDDDRPRRGKKSKGAAAGGGAMLALIGGGVLCLGAIVGLSVWLLSDGDKDTAKDSTNTPAQSTPTNNPGNAANSDSSRDTEGSGGYGMRQRDRGGDSGTGDDRGATSSDSAYGGAMGVNKRRPPAGGGGAITPSTPGGGNVGAGGSPFAGLGGRTDFGTMGEWATMSGDGFTVEFPGVPETISQSVPGAGGQNVSVKLHALGRRDGGYVVLSMQFPGSLDQIPGGSQTVITAMFNAMKVRNPQDVTVDGLKGREGEYTDPSGSGPVRAVVVKDRLFLMGAMGKVSDQAKVNRFLNSIKITYRGDGANVAGGGASPDAGFTDPRNGGGFRDPRRDGGGASPDAGLSEPRGFGDPRRDGGGASPDAGLSEPRGFGDPRRGGLGAPPTPGGFQPPVGGGFGGAPQPGGFGMPGGGFGGPQQPGGGLGGFGGVTGDTNPAPFGALTDGNRKANVEPFFTGAFDPAKKEFFTFSSRPGRTITTRLNRFDVSKDFAPAGQFKVPSFVTRAVIDPAKGLLYVATVTRPTVSALGEQMLDQCVGVGDVQVFDLGQIRDGKVKDGGDLKPVATIGFGREIRGLELTPDGATLVVLSSTAGKSPKSFLSAYDTETRKPAQPPKELAEPSWDSCKSPDGKHLLVIDKVEAGKASMVRMYDLSSLTMVKSISLQGGGLDVAATTSGQYAAAVAVNGASKVVLATDNNTRDLDIGVGWKAAAKPGYVEYSSDGKLLFVSGHPGASGSYPRQGQQQQVSAGLDVYEVSDPDAPNGMKKKASIRTAGGQMVGGHFVVSPGGDYIVFHTGAVLETANIGGNNGEGTVGGGGPPGPGGFGAPGAGAPGAGIVAPGGGAGAAGVLGGGLPLPGDPSATTGAPPAVGGGPPRPINPSIPGGAPPGAGAPSRPPIIPSIPGGAPPGAGAPSRPPINPSIPGGAKPGGVN